MAVDNHVAGMQGREKRRAGRVAFVFGVDVDAGGCGGIGIATFTQGFEFQGFSVEGVECLDANARKKNPRRTFQPKGSHFSTPK